MGSFKAAIKFVIPCQRLMQNRKRQLPRFSFELVKRITAFLRLGPAAVAPNLA